MPGPATETLNDDLKQLKDDVHRLDVGLAEIRTELRLLVGLAKLVIGLVVGLGGGAFVSSAVAGIWWASSITSDVRHLEVQVAEIRKSVDELKKGLATPPAATPAPRVSSAPSGAPAPK